MLRVFSTNRGVREFYNGFADKNTLLPKAITIAEFESKAILTKRRVFIDEESRFLLLKKASKFDTFSHLQFDSEFITFLNHSTFIFKFFDELASEEIEIEDLREFDTYALFDEHLDVLKILQKRYIDLLDENGFVDKINLNSLYEINSDYLNSIEQVELQIDGFLNRYEINLFEKCSKTIPFYISVELNRYNKKTKDTLEDMGFDLEDNFHYKLDISNKKIISKLPIANSKLTGKLETFNTRISQIGYIFYSIDEFVKNGIKPQDIVVVLPDESLVSFLKEFDMQKNLNFAMGFSLDDTYLYKKIEAIELYLNSNKDEHKTRVEKLEIPTALLQEIKINFKTKLDPKSALDIIKSIFILDEKESKEEILIEEIFRFHSFLSKLDLLTLEQIFRLFLKRLKQKSKDDVRGGMVTVMGLLETRGCSFEGVIVPDFSDDFVPRRSQKDLFLNTSIRKSAKIPTKKDRENLQKYYYYQLFKNAKKLAISSVQNETTMPSRFLDELGFSYSDKTVVKNYNHILFAKREKFIPKVKYIEGISYDLTKSSLSATKLNTLLTCKRKFYFKYIEKIKEPKNIITKSNASVGLKLHKTLEKIFSKGFVFDDEKKIKRDIQEELLKNCTNDLEEFELQNWIILLDNFIQNEKRRYDAGYRIFDTERELNTNFEGFSIQGKIDRLDIKDSKLYVIDYKSGDTEKLLKQNIKNLTNFQLEFYYLLTNKLGDVQDVSFYDLKKGELESEFALDLKIKKLKELLGELKDPIVSFDLCEKHSNCIYCPYKRLCLR